MSTTSKKTFPSEERFPSENGWSPKRSGLDQIGTRLHAMRRAERTTLDQLAADSGLSAGYLSQIEKWRSDPFIDRPPGDRRRSSASK